MERQTVHYLFVGLGNPGKRYENTRHNLGFMVLDQFAKKHRVTFEKSARFEGETVEMPWKEGKLHLLKPHTYMNLSGKAVFEMAQFFKILPRHIVAIADDADLPFGILRFREKGSAGGHRGLKNIEEHLGTQGYPRLKIGIGRSSFENLEDFVLAPFFPEEKKILPQILGCGGETLEMWLNEGSEKAAHWAGSFHIEIQKQQKSLE